MNRPKNPFVTIGLILAAIFFFCSSIYFFISPMKASIRPYMAGFLVLATVAMVFLKERRK